MLRRLIATILVLAVLAVGTLTPKRAQATDTALIVVGAVAAYVIFIATAAYFIFRKPPPASTQEMPQQFMPGTSAAGLSRDQPDDTVRYAIRCRQDSGNVTIACW